MRTLAFDGRMGASGDMLLGALLAVGADQNVLAPVEANLPVRYVVESVDRSGVTATHVTVRHEEAEASEAPSDDDGAVEGDTGHGHGHDHDHDSDHGHGHAHAEGHGPERTFEEVVELVNGMDLPADVTEDATAVFRILGEAEAAVHGTTLAETHFHEVGADDAIADIVGVTLLLADLDPERVVTTPVNAGSGEVTMVHGTYPVPPPAVVEIAERADWSLRGGPVEGELLTPTGAALLAQFADGVETLPALTIEASGYGAGTRTYPDRPNVLRASIGEASGQDAQVGTAQESGLNRDPITVLETTVDDVTPEVLGGLHETLAAVGARDVAVLPATMKKSRPGHVVQVITKPEDAAAVARRLAEETGTLGIREGAATHRWIADRKTTSVSIDIEGESYRLAVKVAMDGQGTVYDVSAEYDDAKAVAAETGLPIRTVMRRAETAYEDEA
ncbi:MAG: nickel pincer cofactor biosynthesis protein LarC [Halobacteriales archaeon]|nr:nickel pincer cofactor biosynthesis protein LarC [Halobacteriales archaeon]